MRKLGYQPGLGLGRNEDGILDPVIMEARIGTEGLGFNPYDQVTLSRKDWKLGEYFVRHSKLLDPNEPPNGEGCHQIHPQEKGKELLIEGITDSSSDDDEVETYEDIFGTWEEFHESDEIRGSSFPLEESFQMLSCNMIGTSDSVKLPKKKRRFPKRETTMKPGKSKTPIAKKSYTGQLRGDTGEQDLQKKTAKPGRSKIPKATKWCIAPQFGIARGRDLPP